MIDGLGAQNCRPTWGAAGGFLGSQPDVPQKRGKAQISAKPERTERLQVILAIDELVAIDGLRFQARMPNRAAAIRELLRRGLASAKTLESRGTAGF
jgi:hypothetical protein